MVFGDLSIPSDLLDLHEVGTDAIIDGLGKICELIYPPKTTECPNCYYDPRTRRSNNIYKSGGPKPFENNTICPWCGGVGRSVASVAEQITLRIYWNPSEWSVVGSTIQNPEGVAQVIGYITDLPKLERAQEIMLNKGVDGIRKYRCQREGEATPWGFRQNRYFSQFLRRIGGG